MITKTNVQGKTDKRLSIGDFLGYCFAGGFSLLILLYAGFVAILPLLSDQGYRESIMSIQQQLGGRYAPFVIVTLGMFGSVGCFCQAFAYLFGPRNTTNRRDVIAEIAVRVVYATLGIIGILFVCVYSGFLLWFL